MTNRLAQEISPYLQQHAHNPVDWYPWGPEALSRAKAEDRPILLSIGYSACHWCHVMERESFDDADTAALMNRLFVNVKVDREERPDLDQLYQLVVQLMRKSGGWPLTVFLTPDKRPFFGGTYFPPTPRYGMPDFRTVLRAVHDAYTARRDEVESSAEAITDAIRDVSAASAEPADPPADAAMRAARTLASRFDETRGGFGDRPKFPNTMALDVMLRAARRGDEASLARVRRALDAMRDGGIYDHLGGGFHRYSTDERWLVPHFEKMLYDNALLARLYVDAWRATGEAPYAQTARETLAYVEREMCRPDGLFYATQDADSEGEEGRFFVWTPRELVEVLGEEDARVVALRYGVSEEGNFERTGASVLHASRSIEAVARQLERPEEDVRAAIERSRAALFAHREQREKPFRDEKVIATWNAMMIGAFAEAGAALDERRYVEVAARALDALRTILWRPEEGTLSRIAKDGVARIDGFLEDYAGVANAALDVHRATLDPEALAFAVAVAEAALARFADDAQGGFFFAAPSDELLVRAKDAYDHAVPSGTSSMVHAALRLHALTDDERWLAPAERAMRALATPALENPMGFAHLLGALDRYANGGVEVVVVSAPEDPRAEALLRVARRAWALDLTLARVAPGESPRPGAGSLVARALVDGQPAATVCRGRTCSLPVTEPDALAALLRE